MKTSEKILIQKLQEGDSRAIDQFVDMYAPEVYCVILKYVQNHHDAEELCDDVFITCLDKLSSFSQDSSIKTWLIRIAINKSLDFIRYKKNQKNTPNYNTLEVTSDIYQSYTEKIDYTEDTRDERQQHFLLYACIRSLADRQRTAIMLQLSNMSNQDIADIMSTSVKSVEGLLRRARINLKDMLESGTSRLFADLARV